MSEHKEPDNNPEGIAFIDGFGGGAIGSDRSLSLEQRLAFLKLPIAERGRILASRAEAMSAYLPTRSSMAGVNNLKLLTANSYFT